MITAEEEYNRVLDGHPALEGISSEGRKAVIDYAREFANKISDIDNNHMMAQHPMIPDDCFEVTTDHVCPNCYSLVSQEEKNENGGICHACANL